MYTAHVLCAHTKLQIGARGAIMPLNVTASKYTKKEHHIFIIVKLSLFNSYFDLPL